MADWHQLSPQETLEALSSTASGLSSREAAQRLGIHGPNRLPQPRRRSGWVRFLLQFHNMLIYVLLASAGITASLAHWADTSVIIGVVFINALTGFIQEGKAEKAMEAIRRMLPVGAQVLREGKRMALPAELLVPGDIVLLQSGDKVPADIRLLSAKNLRIEEAALTGESGAVDKTPAAVEGSTALGDRTCMGYSGTLVAYGQGMGVVVGTGMNTEIGRVSLLLSEVRTLTTPLLRQMERFGLWLSAAIVALAAVMFALGMLLHHFSAADMFIAAVSMAVAAIPEGLPAVLTITLALGVQRMAKRRAIVRRLPAVEALGTVTVICTDKTGTLTTNEMTVQRVVASGQTFEVSGAGYAPRGGFSLSGSEAAMAEHAELQDFFRAGLLCNDAVLEEKAEGWQCTGDPTECALITLAMKSGMDPAFENDTLPRADVIPFESEHRFMATLHHDHAGHAVVYLKGAPEVVLALCDRQRRYGDDQPLDPAYWEDAIAQMGAGGLRALALAVKPVPPETDYLDFAAVRAGGFSLLGISGISDPPREEAIAAVERCRSAGIRVKMITGDHAATARAIGARMGIANERVIAGVELDALDSDALRRVVGDIDIFARASPEHKLRLVEALQANGEIVAMTGDGVNDSPALKRADIGLAMGRKGTEAAKEAAEMVLADDNFATIADAVEEGRTIYDNIQKAIAFIMPTNGAEAWMVLFAVLFGITLPITPVQILWINMVTAITLALALSFETPEPGIMHRPPRAAAASILSGFLVWRIVFVSVLLTTGSMGLFLLEGMRGASMDECRTVAINALVAGEAAYLFNCRYLLQPVRSWRDFTGNRYVLLTIGILAIIQVLFTYVPVMNRIFGGAPLDLAEWGLIVSFALLAFAAVEIEKSLIRRNMT
ncbi:MAG TPA: cation-transporting P-type ATPase [Gallionellaceae bacterium]|nr:cation-transporting P-type ATPase [Gallionellaceae bacterium]